MGTDLKQLLGGSAQEAVELTGNEAHQQSGNDGALPDALDTLEQNQGEDDGHNAHGHVHTDLDGAELLAGLLADGVAGGLTGQHDHIGGHFHEHAEAQDQAADQQHHNPLGIAAGDKPAQHHVHGEVDKIAEKEGDGDLQQLDHTEVLPEHQNLAGDEQQAPDHGELADGGLKAQAQHVGDAGNGGCAQIHLGDKGDAQRVYKQTNNEKDITLDEFRFLHSNFLLMCNILFRVFLPCKHEITGI